MNISLNVLIVAAAIVGGATYIGICIKEASRNILAGFGREIPSKDVLN